MGAGALSDLRVVRASAQVIPILVDCTRPGANKTLLDTYQVRAFPTLLFVGSEGETLGKPHRRDADTLVQLMDQLGQQTGGSASRWSAVVILIAIVIAVPCGLVLIYKKWFAREAESES